jgi:two-component system cell cycle response regulator
MAAREIEAEVLRLRRRIAALTDEAANNERLLKKTQQRELELLKAGELPQLFDVICNRLAVSNGLEIVTLILWDPDHEIRHLLLGMQVRLEEFSRVLFVDETSALDAYFQPGKRPNLGPYRADRHQSLFKTAAVGSVAIASVALIPLWQQDQLRGCICFGSRDERRFHAQLATDFLSHLGVIASFAIDNAINRARLVRSGLTDFLTGWHNRRYLHERLKEELSRAQRTNAGVACVLLDLDYFKIINDTHGHLVGDMALREAADRINLQIRGSDAAARFGGDEFVVLAPAMSREQAAALAERMRQSVCGTPLNLPDGSQHSLTVSVGVAVMQMGDSKVDIKTAAEQLLAEADAALYRAKQKGRNRVDVVVC